MAKTKRIVVIGAGIIGVATAIYLQRDGHDVVLIDKTGPAGGASYGNGGVLVSSGVMPVNAPGLLQKAPAMLMRPDSPLFVNWSYLPKMLPWLFSYMRRANQRDTRQVARALKALLHDSPGEHMALAKGTGAEKWIKPSDYLFIYNSKAAFEKDAFGWSLRRDMGFEWDELDAQSFKAYDSIFEHTDKFAIRLRDHGIITDPEKYVLDLVKHFKQQDGQLQIAKASTIVHENKHVSGVKSNNGLIKCDALVVAAGAWSKSLAEPLGIKVPLEAERGYHIDLINSSIMPRSTMMCAAGKFVITPMRGRLRCAGVVEFGGLEAPPNKAPHALLKKHIHQLFPDLTYDRIDEWMGHRPALTDSIPMIGAIENVSGVYTAFGHHHVGLAGSARSGRLVADMIANRDTQIDAKPYRSSRFSS